jgi:hypothetical protein
MNGVVGRRIGVYRLEAGGLLHAIHTMVSRAANSRRDISASSSKCNSAAGTYKMWYMSGNGKSALPPSPHK